MKSLMPQEERLLNLDSAANAILQAYDLPFIEQEIKRVEDWGARNNITLQHAKYREWNNALTILRMQKITRSMAQCIRDTASDFHMLLEQNYELQEEVAEIRHRLYTIEATISMVANPKVAEYLASRVLKRKKHG